MKIVYGVIALIVIVLIVVYFLNGSDSADNSQLKTGLIEAVQQYGDGNYQTMTEVEILQSENNFVKARTRVTDGPWNDFYGSKETGKWELYFPGHDRPVCEDIEQFNFPASLIGSCFNIGTDELIAR